MLTASQKDKYNTIQKYAKNPSLRNKLSLQLFLDASQKDKLKDAAILACLKGLGQDSSAISYFQSILEGFPQDIQNPFSSNRNIQSMDAQSLYRQALMAFDINPQNTQYFKNKKVKQENKE